MTNQILTENFKSKLLEKTTILSIPANEGYDRRLTKEQIESFWQPVIAREVERGVPEVDLQPGLMRLAPYHETKNIECAVYRYKESFERKVYHLSDVTKEAYKKKIAHSYSFTEAKLIIREAILAGEVDIDNPFMSIRVNYKDNGLYEWIWAHRKDGRLIVETNDGSIQFRLSAGGGICLP